MIDKMKELIANVTESGEIFLSDFGVLTDFTDTLSEESKEQIMKKLKDSKDLVFKEFEEFSKRFEFIFS